MFICCAFSKIWSPFINTLLEFCNYDETMVNMICAMLVELVAYFIPSLIFDVFEEQLKDYLLEPEKHTKKEIKYAAWKQAILGTFILHPISFYVVFHLSNGAFVADDALPLASDYIFYFVLSYYSNDCFFYITHRIFHEFPILYQFHKRHHEFNFTRGVSAQYAHPLEAVLSNILPTVSGTLIWIYLYGEIHISMVMIFFTYRLYDTTYQHSGFRFPYWFSFGNIIICDAGKLTKTNYTGHHYFHHSHNTGNYGSPHLDWLFGTDKSYRKFIQKEEAKKTE